MEIYHHVYFHVDGHQSSDHADKVVLQLLRQINKRSETILLDLSALTAAVEGETSAVQAAITLIKELADEIKAQAGDPAAVAALADKLTASAVDLGAAVVANTPADEGTATDTPPSPAPADDTPPADTPAP